MDHGFKSVEVNAHLSTGAVVTANGVEYKAGTLPGEKLFHMGVGGRDVDELYELRPDGRFCKGRPDYDTTWFSGLRNRRCQEK
jgi:hypothetical protein